MSNQPHEVEDTDHQSFGRKRWITLALLFLLTLGATVAAKQIAPEQKGESRHGMTQPEYLQRLITHDGLSFAGKLDRGSVQVGRDGLVHLELTAIGKRGDEVAPIRRPTDVVVILDRSGSMGGDPMRKALAAIYELVNQLGRKDRFALVTYSDEADLMIPLSAADLDAQVAWISRIESIGSGGGTNMAAGLDLAHKIVSQTRTAGRVARVILLSDGHANQGDSSPEGLARRSGRAVTGEYVLSTVGVGDGFDERLMTRLADAGTGNFYYVPYIEVLAGIFGDEFDSARETVASGLEIRIETPLGVEVVEAAGYPVERRPGLAVIRPGSLFAGQERSFWVTLRVPSDRVREIKLGRVSLAYTTVEGKRREARLDAFSMLSAVADKSQFVASLDDEAVEAFHAGEVVNRLRQSVSELVSGGDYDEARMLLGSVDYSDLVLLGRPKEETESFVEVEKMIAEVNQAAAAPAPAQAEIRNRLGKAFFSAGTDGRRKGAKR